MEALSLLEKKITDLLDVVRKLKDENAKLIEENLQLQEKIEAFEATVLTRNEETEQEKELTKTTIDGLIKSIESLVESEKY